MMSDSMVRFRGCETIAAEHVWELREELLNLRRSGEERCTSEGRLRARRGVKNHRLQTLSMNNLPPLDVYKEVEVFQEICTQEGNRYWSQLERPGINFRILSTRESERNDLSTTANHH